MDSSPAAQMITRNLTADLEVAGRIERIAIITVGLHPCACQLASRLKPAGVDVRIFDQDEFPVPDYSWRFFKRLYKRRGLCIALDNFMLYAFGRLQWLAGGTWRRIRRVPRVQGRVEPARVDVPVVKVRHINRSPGTEMLREFAPDLILLAGAPILSAATVGIARVACINTHCGITPLYAGSSPETWAVYERNFDAVGFTIHIVSRNVDGGPVLYQERVRWDRDQRVDLLWPKLATLMYQKLADITLDLIGGKAFTATPQSGVRAMPPAGLVVRMIAEHRRKQALTDD